MTPTTPSAGSPSASGVRRGGDKFQDLVAWCGAIRLLGDSPKFVSLQVEARDAGNVDDVVLVSANGDRTFTQVKWSTRAGALLDESYLLRTIGTGTSLLQKLFRSFQRLRPANDTDPALKFALVSNRSLDSSHPLLGRVDGRTDLLVPFAADATLQSSAGRALTRWAEHVEASREELLDMLRLLQFRVGRPISAEREHAQDLMRACGLKDDESALSVGLGEVADWVVAGRREIQPEFVRERVEALELVVREPSAVLVVQAIDFDPHPEDADACLDWVELYPGNDPRDRVLPADPVSWTRMQEELAEAIARLESLGWHSAIVRGYMRLATYFAIGAHAPRTRGWSLAVRQRQVNGGSAFWSTEAARVLDAPPLELHTTSIGCGPDLAVVVSISADALRAAHRYVLTPGLEVGTIISFTPADGAHDQFIGGAGHAVTISGQVVTQVREVLEDSPQVRTVHLFLAGPSGLALILGNRWNRMRTTIVYEHVGAGRGYAPAFTVP